MAVTYNKPQYSKIISWYFWTMSKHILYRHFTGHASHYKDLCTLDSIKYETRSNFQEK